MVSQFHAHAKPILGSSFYAIINKQISMKPFCLLLDTTIIFVLKHHHSGLYLVQRGIREVGVSSLNNSSVETEPTPFLALTYRTNQGQT